MRSQGNHQKKKTEQIIAERCIAFATFTEHCIFQWLLWPLAFDEEGTGFRQVFRILGVMR